MIAGTGMGNLEVPGAQLHYERRGSGPVLLMVPGANGSADAFATVAEYLAARYTVVTYDRRGFSRSQLDGPQDYDHRLQTDADDAWHLLEYLSDQSAIVFGCSSGAIVALEFFRRHHSAVGTLVPFEPPAVRQLEDGQKWLDFFSSTYALYRQSGPQTALHKFREQAFAESDRQVMAHTMDHNDRARMVANATYWFEHELRQYPAVDLDVDMQKAHSDRIVLAVGRESSGHPAYDVNVELAKKLRTNIVELTGGHLGFVSQPAEFAHELQVRLARHEKGPQT